MGVPILSVLSLPEFYQIDISNWYFNHFYLELSRKNKIRSIQLQETYFSGFKTVETVALGLIKRLTFTY